MQELPRIYRQALPAHIAELERARAAGGAQAVAAMRDVAHKLRGSGATYGFADVSEAAAAVEHADAAVLGARVEDLLAVLRRTVEAG